MTLRAPLPSFEDQFASADRILASALAELIETLRPRHPVSILELSADEAAAVALAAILRTQRRKVRVMAYDWEPGIVLAEGVLQQGARHRGKHEETLGAGEHFLPEGPKVLVEKGRLPGLRFSTGSFDYLAGKQVLERLAPASRCRALSEMRRVALRGVLLIELIKPPDQAALSESLIADALLQAGIRDAALERQGSLLRISF
jgi:hypothetical protein